MKTLKTFLLPAYLALCIALGGASAAGYLANLALQILAVLILVWAFIEPGKPPFSPGERRLFWLIIALCALLLLQFLPLPLSLWSMLGERTGIAEFAQRAGVLIGYPAVSLMPHESLKSAVWVLPALAIVVWMMRTRAYRPGHLAWTIVAMAGLSLVLGALQFGGGRESAYYLYDITNRGSTVGFFANSNHLATLLLVAIPFIAAVVAELSSRHRAQKYPLLAAAAGVLLVMLAGLSVNNSLAGYALVLPVLAGSLLVLGLLGKTARFVPLLIAILVIAGIGLPFLTEEGSAMIGASTSMHPGDRRLIFANTLRAAVDYGPLGSGVGSFREIYRQYQDPLSISNEYINHAHNDYLEILLETGILGAILVLAFLAWWLWRVVKIWDVPSGCVFGKAATIASGAILLHSLVDYPLRTAAISGVFAVCLALMARRTDYEGPPLVSAR